MNNFNLPIHKTTELEERFEAKGLLDSEFKWRDRFGKMWAIRDMSTRHIFYAWLMIWNFVAPEHLKSNMGIRYITLGPSYTSLYCLQAFANFYAALKKHPSLDEEFKKEVERIEAYFWIRSGRPFDGDYFKLLDEDKVKL